MPFLQPLKILREFPSCLTIIPPHFLKNPLLLDNNLPPKGRDMFKLLTFILLFQLVATASSQEIHSHHLKGQIIRSMCAHPDDPSKLLVGIKGDSSASAFVYFSGDSGDNWHLLNDSNSLHPRASDVQAVAFIDDSVLLAGTWKKGIFRSSNGGKSWVRNREFPSPDVRSIVVDSKNQNIVYAATTTSGILKSLDKGLTWQSCGEDSLKRKMASWALKLDANNHIYALTFEGEIYRSNDNGTSWKSLINKEGSTFYDIHIDEKKTKNIWVVGCNDSLGFGYKSKDGGQVWDTLTNLPNALLSAIEVVDSKGKEVILGSWDKGYFKKTKTGWMELSAIETNRSSSIRSTSTHIEFYTWGNGIFRIKK